MRDRGRHLRHVAGQVPDVLSRHAPDGTYLWVSPSVRRVLGRRAPEFTGRTAAALAHPDDQASLPALPADLEHAGGEVRQTCRMRHADGRWLWIETVLRAVRDPQTSAIAWIAGSGRDVTPGMTRVQALERSNAELTRAATVVAHDLREPLVLLRGYAHVVGTDAADRLTDADRHRLEVIARNAARLQARVDALLAHAAVERTSAASDDVDMAVVVDEAIDLLAEQIAGSGAQIRRGPLVHVRGDAALLGALVQNLLANAVRFADGRTPIVDVSCEPAGSGWELVVADNGIGIAPDRRERIFAMFERGADERYAGLGVGLATALRIAELHGGTIAVRSQVGAGSVFTVTIAGDRA